MRHRAPRTDHRNHHIRLRRTRRGLHPSIQALEPRQLLSWITFDPDGSGTLAPPSTILGFRFGDGDVLAQGAIDPATGSFRPSGSTFQLNYQSTIAAINFPNGEWGAPGMNAA